MKKKAIRKTNHPHIVQVEGVCGGRPIIEGTRLAVWHVADYHYKSGMSVEEILMNCENVTLAQLYDALAYYHDHKAEINKDIWENSYEYWIERHAPAQTTPERALVA
jgi:uncharacterized protein (DUF433 family)